MTFSIIIAVTILLIATVMHFLPAYTPVDAPLGVSVPASRREDLVVLAAWQRFRKINAVSAVALLVITVILGVTGHELINIAWIYLQIGVVFYNWISTRKLIQKAKTVQGWYQEVHTALRGSTDAGKPLNVLDPIPVPWWGFITSIVLSAAFALLLWWRWADIPQSYPSHWGPDMQPDAWTQKSVLGVSAGVIIALLFNFLMLAVTMIPWYGRINLRSTNTPLGRARLQSQMEMTQSLMGGLMILLTILLAPMALAPLETVSYYQVYLIIGALVLLAIYLVLTYVLIGRAGKAAEAEVTQALGDAATQPQWEIPDRDRFFKMGMFYYNPEDPALFVEKRSGVSVDFNYGNRRSWWFVGGILLLIVAMSVIPSVTLG
ncbi:hypothetical protein BSR28_05590 [Boudabousia liubingyangii]|uniref:DUF5808 domain-containing protein n=1 Tax=Boudabousia liubingyangii TaxID=1921764 RepID=UPI000939FC10|nr:DUF5808 domain-containing protein [Boudabousia liubingyangii]OKL46898.1 hypothetical protein BSR28_05590 [Boudabousia liubingyangii]